MDYCMKTEDRGAAVVHGSCVPQGHGDGSSVRRRTAGTAPISLLKTEPHSLVRSEEKTPLRAASFSGARQDPRTCFFCIIYI